MRHFVSVSWPLECSYSESKWFHVLAVTAQVFCPIFLAKVLFSQQDAPPGFCSPVGTTEGIGAYALLSRVFAHFSERNYRHRNVILRVRIHSRSTTDPTHSRGSSNNRQAKTAPGRHSLLRADPGGRPFQRATNSA